MLTNQPQCIKLLDTYAPLKRINKYKLKFKSKPWITLDLQKSISVQGSNYCSKVTSQ